MTDRFSVHHEVRRALDEDEEKALLILPALAGEILASGDSVDIADLKDALGMEVLEQGPNHRIADAVLAMVRTYVIGHAGLL